MSDWKQAAIEEGRQYLVRRDREQLRRMADAADGRARTRTAKERHAAALAAMSGPGEIPLPDADDSSIRTVMR